ncbi:MAG: peptidoglycan DD-metalloendopeptidase family protein [Oscillospiraceae bacterium]|nr:peptidoglycan DD-metalloendopeptidase family protein [Oscillospiraceae bacterium]
MKNKKLVVNIFCFFMAFVMCIGLLHPIVASAGTKEDYRAAQERLDKINKEIASLKDTYSKQEKEKKNAQTQINLVKKQISILNSDIKTANDNLLAKQQELEAKKTEIRETDALFKERLKAMYIMRRGGTMSTILAVDSFSQLLTATDTLQRISSADTDLLKQLDEQKKAIEREEVAIQERLNALVEKQGTLETKQNELAGIMQTIDSNLSETEAKQEAAKETQKEVYADYLAAKQAVEAEFGQSASDTFVGGEWIWPVPTNGHISSPYGRRLIFGVWEHHTGIDIATGWGEGWPYINGQAIVASNAGVVKTAIYSNRGYGNYVIIDHGGNNFSLYGHCSKLAVKVGDYVSQGQTVAYVGSTGNSTGPHLHFEIRLNGSCVDPAPLVSASRPRK